MVKLDFDGLNELEDDVMSLIHDYPAEASDALFEVAKEFGDDVNNKYPAYYKDSGKESLKRWKIEGAKEGYSHFVTATNKAPHFHLVENGHLKYDFHGHFTGGFVPGKHYAEKTRQEYEEKYPAIMEEKINALLNKHNL